MAFDCTSCLESPCLCGKAGYLILEHEDIQSHVAKFSRLLDYDHDNHEQYVILLGEWVIEKLMEQEEWLER